MRLALLLLIPLLVQAKSYHYSVVRTEIELRPDGSARVRQWRTYRFDGSFSWAFVDLRKQGSAGIEFNGLYDVTGEDRRWLEPLELRDGPESVYLRWGYSATNETRTFLLDYTLRGVVRRHEDVAEFHWKFIEDEHEPVELVALDLSVPGTSAGLFKLFVHTRAPPGEMALDPGAGKARAVVRGVPRNAFVEARLLAEPGLFPGAPSTGRPAYERILGEERRNFAAATLRTYVLLPLALLLGLVLPVGLLIIYYRRHGREPRLDYQAIYEHEPPRNAPPAYVPAILVQQADVNRKAADSFWGLVATLIELARRGLVRVEQTGTGRKTGHRFTLVRDPGEAASDVELLTLRLVFDEAGEGGPVTDEELRKWCAANASMLRPRLRRVFDDGRRWWARELGGPLLDAGSRRAAGRYSLVALGLVAAGVALAGFGLQGIAGKGSKVAWALPIAAGLLVYPVLAGLASTIHRWTPAAHLEHRRWRLFEKFLRDFSAIEQAPVTLLAIWDQYFVYAVALGVAEQFLKNIGRLAAERGVTPAFPAWYVAGRGATVGTAGLAGFQQGLSSLAAFSGNLTSMAAALSPRSSSGGGFSGGGGGGGGGGSSGAG